MTQTTDPQRATPNFPRNFLNPAPEGWRPMIQDFCRNLYCSFSYGNFIGNPKLFFYKFARDSLYAQNLFTFGKSPIFSSRFSAQNHPYSQCIFDLFRVPINQAMDPERATWKIPEPRVRRMTHEPHTNISLLSSMRIS